MSWPLEGGQTGIVSVDRNLRGILRRGGEVASIAAAALSKTEAKELFLQLAVPASRKIAFGTVTVTFTAATISAAAKVTHGLGAKPTSVLLTQQGTELGLLFARAQGLTETIFEAVGASPFGAVNGTAVFAWVAVG